MLRWAGEQGVPVQKVAEVKSACARIICNSRQDEGGGCRCGGFLSAVQLVRRPATTTQDREEGEGVTGLTRARGKLFKGNKAAGGLLIRQVKISQETGFPRKASWVSCFVKRSAARRKTVKEMFWARALLRTRFSWKSRRRLDLVVASLVVEQGACQSQLLIANQE